MGSTAVEHPSVVSLFAGCGGFDFGFESTDYQVVRAYDNDPAAVEAYNKNLKGTAQLADLRENVAIPDADVIIATPPCQGFSTLGGSRGDDPRNNLVLRACTLAMQVKPHIFALENVSSITNKVNRHVLSTASALLSAAGYHIEMVCLNLENFGLPQKRKRFFLVARDKCRPFNLNFMPLKQLTTVADAIGRLPHLPRDIPSELKAGTRARGIAEVIKPGQKLSNVRRSPASVHTWDIPDIFGRVTGEERTFLDRMIVVRRTSRMRGNGDADPVTLSRIKSEFGEAGQVLLNALLSKGFMRCVDDRYDLCHTFNGTYRRLRWESTAPTVDTHFGDARLFLHPEEHRGLSHLEAAALQSFPNDFKWPDSKRSRFRLIGNAVPPIIGKLISQTIRQLL